MRGVMQADGSYNRAIDNEGRVVLPSQFRDRMQVQPGDVVRISFDGERISVERSVAQCVDCGSEDIVAEWFPTVWVCDRHARVRLAEVEDKVRRWASAG